MSIYRDFDAMFPELSGNPSDEGAGKGCIKLFGKKYYFSLNPPAALVLEMVRHSTEKNMPWQSMVRLAYAIFGEDALNEMSMHPAFTTKILGAIIDYAVRAINGLEESAPAEMTEDDFGAPKTKKK